MQKFFFSKVFTHFSFIIEENINFPLRLKAAGLISFFLCFLNTFVVILAASTTPLLISSINTQISYLKTLDENGVFMIISLINTDFITNKQGIELGNRIIDYLSPIFVCTTISMICGFGVALVSIFNLFFMFKLIILMIRQEGSESSTLRKIWKFKAHNSIFFCVQFIVNSLFLINLVAFFVFSTVYTLALHEIQANLWDYIKTRQVSFWIVLIPLILA